MINQRISAFLEQIKAEGRSSPTGMHWNDFYGLLKSHKKQNGSDPPAPLILAASGESNASKHQRLSKQLEWALDHHCLDEALSFLTRLHSDQWSSGSLEKWNENSYWTDE